MTEFYKGQIVRRVDGTNFSNGQVSMTVASVDHGVVWFEETGTNLREDQIVDYNAFKLHYPQKPNAVPAKSSQHLKADSGKLQWSLVMDGCPKAMLGVVKVMTVAITPKPVGRGYARDSWKLVPDAKIRYKDAIFRHLAAIAAGEVYDNGPEGTGQLHWDCVATNALFLSEFAHGEYDVPTENSLPTT